MANNNFKGYEPVSVTGMARGFTSMIKFYFFLGLLLGLCAFCIGGPLFVMGLFYNGNQDSSSSSPYADGQPDSQSNDHYKPNNDTPKWLRPYVGSYDRHGQTLDIAPDGRGLFRSRTYTTCAENPEPPCEKELGEMARRIEFTVKRSSGGVVARANDRELPIVLVKPGIVEYDNLTFCDSEVVSSSDPATDACGA